MEVIDLDDPNYVNDERLARRLKRRRLDIKTFELNTCSRTLRRTLEDNQLGDGMVDEDFNKSLNHLGLCSESRCSRGEDDDEDDIDPQYKMFLEKLKEDGKSYVLEVAVSNGMSTYIKYEAEDGSDDEHEPQTLRKSRDVSKRVKLEGGRGLMNVQSKDKMETHKNLRTKHPVSRETNGCRSQKPSLEDNPLSDPECGCQMVDENYQEFLNCTKLEGDCMVLTLKDGKRVTYEEDDVERSSDLRNISTKDKMETPMNLSNVLEKGRNSVVENDLKSVPECPVSPETNGCWSQKRSPKDNHLSGPECGSQLVDESYQAFLSCIKLEGGCLVLATNDGKTVKYEEEEEDVESSSDPEILVTDNVSYCNEGNYNPFVTSRLYDPSMEGDGWHCVGNPNKSNHSQFREKLISILRRPYDNNEYEELLEEINARKPMEGRRELRGGTKSYSADKCSKSYLDHHSDLRSKIDAQFDRRKVLNLLRGFFFWLKNLSHEGAFRPWLDTVCLAVMPV
ncbi:hypothetical protein F0562_002807 [Nyssa sinensis]|uniref:Uncharacterized protein n=1 Tax=Nyssa sinensis TaxID=561372 RepID=A0A5J5BUZ5_9ASTE|nr:hypothetical protein F0562_002807 [Nyssa sinensis]